MYITMFWSNLVSVQSFISVPFHLLPFWNSHYAYDGILDGLPQVSEAVFSFFHSFFFLFLRLYKFHLSIFKFANSFSYQFKSAFLGVATESA